MVYLLRSFLIKAFHCRFIFPWTTELLFVFFILTCVTTLLSISPAITFYTSNPQYHTSKSVIKFHQGNSLISLSYFFIFYLILLYFFYCHLVPLYSPHPRNYLTGVHVHESFYLYAKFLHPLPTPPQLSPCFPL